jgi:hypothetical protein
LDIQSEFTETRLTNGNILFESMMETDQVMIVNMETGDQQILDGYKFVSGKQSPNHQWIAINEYGKGKLMLLDANGKLYEVSEWDEKWQWISGWLNEDQLIIGLVDEGDYSRLPPLGLLNIQTKEYREIIRNYPRHTIIDEFEPFLSWYTTTFFNPTLSLVAYPAYPEDDWDKSFILFDLRSNRIITELMDYRTRTIAPPQWTPDGDHLLIAKEDYPGEPLPSEDHEEFFLISSEGEIIQLTHFNDYHEFSRIGSFAFSFDGRYVAFWFQEYSISKDEFLYVLDLNTQEVMNTCLSSQRTPSVAPVWSPKNYYLIAVLRSYKDESDPNSVFNSIAYIDVNDGFAVKITEDMWTLGWLYNKPRE